MLPLHDTLTAVALTAVICNDSGLSESEVDSIQFHSISKM